MEVYATAVKATANEAHSDKSTINWLKPSVLGKPDETTDVILVVEGKELHANRAVLAHYSPVFRKMFFSDFKEKSEEKVPLPGKTYADMVLFFNTLFPWSPESVREISDENLLPLLTLADEYEAHQVKDRCQDYIGRQLYEKLDYTQYKPVLLSKQTPGFTGQGFPGFGGIPQLAAADKKKNINKLALYMICCDKFDLPEYRDRVRSLLITICRNFRELSESTHYKSLPEATQISLLELLCEKLSIN